MADERRDRSIRQWLPAMWRIVSSKMSDPDAVHSAQTSLAIGQQRGKTVRPPIQTMRTSVRQTGQRASYSAWANSKSRTPGQSWAQLDGVTGLPRCTGTCDQEVSHKCATKQKRWSY